MVSIFQFLLCICLFYSVHPPRPRHCPRRGDIAGWRRPNCPLAVQVEARAVRAAPRHVPVEARAVRAAPRHVPVEARAVRAAPRHVPVGHWDVAVETSFFP